MLIRKIKLSFANILCKCSPFVSVGPLLFHLLSWRAHQLTAALANTAGGARVERNVQSTQDYVDCSYKSLIFR